MTEPNRHHHAKPRRTRGPQTILATTLHSPPHAQACYQQTMRARLLHLAAVTTLLLTTLIPLRAQSHPDWTTPLTPFRIAPNLYYVGSRDLASYLVTTPAGDILINSNLATSPPQIRHSVEQLGFHFSDIKILLISHAHSDHASGSAAILKQTHAKYMVMDGDVSSIESGGRTDFAHFQPWPPAHVDRVLHDGSTVQLGGVTLTARKTAGHTPGTTTWTMQVIDNGKPLNVVIVGSVTALSEYDLVATPGHPASYPGIAQDFAHTFAELDALPCDIFLSSHGEYFDLLNKFARMKTEGSAVFIDPTGYKRAIAQSRAEFEADLAHQQAVAHHHS
jgi:metallo-beta-lactamase class B